MSDGIGVVVSPLSNNQHVDFLRETLNLAGRELQSRVGLKMKIAAKADASLVTDADLAAEKIILDRIRKYFPEDLIYSEEAGLSSQNRIPGQFIWIVDPLDGTTNFTNGYPFYSVSIARGRFRADGSIESLLGGIEDPNRGKTYVGVKGQGAFVNDGRLAVAAARPLAQSFLVTGFYYMKGEQLIPEVERFARVAQRCQSIRRDGSAALDLALVAEGVYDAFWEAGLQPWDVAAGTLLVAEAGGLVLNYSKDLKQLYNLEGVGMMAGSASIVAAIAALL